MEMDFFFAFDFLQGEDLWRRCPSLRQLFCGSLCTTGLFLWWKEKTYVSVERLGIEIWRSSVFKPGHFRTGTVWRCRTPED